MNVWLKEFYRLKAEEALNKGERTETERREPFIYEDYLRSAEWWERREKALAAAGYRCQLCNGTNSLNVHHRTYERIGREKPEDLTVLCRSCHAKFHDKPE